MRIGLQQMSEARGRWNPVSAWGQMMACPGCARRRGAAGSERLTLRYSKNRWYF